MPGLYLAGDHTRQPYVATMEGAVVSGHLAAQAAIARLKARQTAPPPRTTSSCR